MIPTSDSIISNSAFRVFLHSWCYFSTLGCPSTIYSYVAAKTQDQIVSSAPSIRAFWAWGLSVNTSDSKNLNTLNPKP